MLKLKQEFLQLRDYLELNLKKKLFEHLFQKINTDENQKRKKILKIRKKSFLSPYCNNSLYYNNRELIYFFLDAFP